MKYAGHKKLLQAFYNQKGLQDLFECDNDYLEEAFKHIQALWLENFKQITRIKYLLIAEAPLWGKKKKYIYNPATSNSQFFYRSDLSDVLKRDIPDKKEFLQCCNEIGLLVIDISPFALNPNETNINYRQLSGREYRWLVSATMPDYFEKKIELIQQKRARVMQAFFRYARVMQTFHDLIAPVLIKNKLITSHKEIGDISQSGGGINKQVLKQIITPGQ